MEKVEKDLEKIITSLKGNLICIGLSSKYLIDKIQKREEIAYCDLLNNHIFTKDKESRKEKHKKKKTLSFSNFRKYYKHKNINYTICNIREIYKMHAHFIPDSVYINSDFIYIYGSKDFDYEKIERKYKRYNIKVEKEIYEKTFLLKLDLTNKKINFFKARFFFLIDSLDVLLDMISDLITS